MKEWGKDHKHRQCICDKVKQTMVYSEYFSTFEIYILRYR